MISQKSNILFVSVLFFIFILQSWTKANDSIRDLQIEGMSIGDSALDYFTKSDIINNSKNYYKNNKFTKVQNDFYDFFETYDAVDYHFKTGDTKYEFHNLGGVLIYQNNIQDCYPKMDEISLSIENNFTYVKKYEKESFKHSGDSTGKSIITDITYKFKDGFVVILCYDYSKEYGGQDHLSVAIDTNELNNWLIDDAWK